MTTVAQDLRRSFFAAATIAVLVVLQSLASAEPLAPNEPPNVGDAKFAAIAYYKSGAYERDLGAVASRVSARLAERAPQVSRAALVLDIDDTVLSNWEVIMADDFGRVFDGPCRSLPNGPCGWVAWDLRARTPAIQQMLAVFKQARSLGVAVFFISGRDQRQRAATIKNLRATGFAGYRGLYLEANGARYASAADFKTPVRERIEKDGYTIIANVGDQPSDLAGGHAEMTFFCPIRFIVSHDLSLSARPRL
jgi:predicted secreted acid phosphatase